ncbi:fumarylacetoacetate hydrolase family protein [Acuticoccus sp. M5D2P5]|uniref:fumarylacetoacetate hydrolase family protein n=1 Tax=Acuticoccus kalidii TaxID=2910977 RepID=UPI001F19DFD2|nr:fumarylacetoacetate hydrolase family protein [Acuticoccus kalidii]MCF3932732.1 fumarylacetoacetate hydrolase family protein [Acuticoccus kalidii]
MKFVSFTRLGTRGFGAVVDGGVVNLTRRLGHRSDTLKSAIASDALASAAEYVDGRAPDFAMSDITFLPLIPDPAKIFCIGVNYEEHKAETQRPDVDHPTIFTRWGDSLVGHRQALIKPNVSNRFDYEGEMAIIIGRGGRNIPAEKAFDHIAGYSIFNDGSVRDFQRHTSQFTPGKNFPGTGGFGPYLVTPDEVGDYTKLPIETRLNGEVLQKATLDDLIFTIPTLIEYISTFTPLTPGDVIATGTPGGVGDKRQPPVYMRPGDTVEIEVGVLGTLVNPVMAEM